MKIRKFCAAVLIAAMTLSLAACGGDQAQSSGTDTASDSYVWVPEYVEMPEDTDVYNAVVYDGKMYVVSDNWEDDIQTDTTFEQISLTDGTVTELFAVERTPAEAEAGDEVSYYRYSNYYSVTSDASFVTVDSAYSYNGTTGESSQVYYLCRYSASGELTYEIDITDDVDPDGSGSGYVQSMALDGEERIYVALDATILLYDGDGNLTGQIAVDTSTGWLQNLMQLGDGQVYYSYYDYNSNSGSYELHKVDFDTKSADTVLENLPVDANYMAVGASETELMVCTGTSVYQYDVETQTSEKLFDWLDCDIYGSYVNGIAMAEDGRLVAIVNDWETDSCEMAFLKKTEASQVAQKTQIVVGTFYDISSLSSQIVKFNKTSDQYHVTLRTYVDYTDAETEEDYENAVTDAYTRLNNEITSDDCPDILLLENLNVDQLAAKGVLEDLTPYLESSAVLSKEDYFETVLQAYTYQDALVGIPQTFSLITIAGKTSEVGEEVGWTLDEMMAYADEHPDTQIFEYTTKTGMLQNLISYSQSKYIDWETGTCSFDREEFIKVLEFANRFPDEANYDEDEPATPIKLASGQLLLNTVSIYSADELQVTEAEFGEPVTYIGFPNEDGATGTYLRCSSPLAITSKSENKNAAWAFLESFLTSENDWYSYGLYARIDKFEEQVAASMTTDYVDENGDLYLNEDGYALTGGGMSYGDDEWSYDYRVTTEEEADLLREMIENAQPSNSMDSQILSIITEEADSYFSGDKSAADAAAVIQSRVQIYVNEQQ